MIRDLINDFKNFLLRGNVVDLAVAVVVGAAFGTIISALVKDLITPLIASIGREPSFSNLYFTVNHSKFMYGDFINAIISFLIIAFVVFFLIVQPVNKLIALSGLAVEKELGQGKCPECLSIIPRAAKRCAFCTSVVNSAAAPDSAELPSSAQPASSARPGFPWPRGSAR